MVCAVLPMIAVGRPEFAHICAYSKSQITVIIFPFFIEKLLKNNWNKMINLFSKKYTNKRSRDTLL